MRGELRDAEPAVGGGSHPGVAALGAPRVQTSLGLFDTHVIGHGAPDPLRSNMIGLLDHALAVPAPRRARLDRDGVMLGHRGERRAHLPGAGRDHGRHPVETPIDAEPTQRMGDTVQAVDQMRLILRLTQQPTPLARV